jgi:hypothetical protein
MRWISSVPVALAFLAMGCTYYQDYSAATGSSSTNDNGADGGANSNPFPPNGDGGTSALAPTWQWRNPSPGTVAPLRAAYGLSDKDVWFAGDGGAVVHWDGTKLVTAYQSAATDHFTAIFESDPNDVWVAGDHKVVRWDGSKWSDSYSIGDYAVSAIWGASSDDVWAGTDAGVLHWDGGEWITPPATSELSVLYGIRAIWGTASNDVWLVGDIGTIYHFDGSQWTGSTSSLNAGGVSALDGSHNYLAVGGVSTNDVWAIYDVGHKNAGFSHWDGTSWVVKQEIPFNNPLGAGELGASVIALSTNDVYALAGDGYAFHFDGTSWTGAPSEYPVAQMWGSSAGIFLAGQEGDVSRVDASTGSINGSPTHLDTGLRVDFPDVSVSHDGAATWAYGGAYRWADSGGWAYTNPPVNDSRAMSALSASDAWMGGETFGPSGDSGIATLVHWDGASWDAPVLVLACGPAFYGVAMIDSTHGFAVSSGCLAQYDGEKWSVVHVDNSLYFYGVWASSPTDVWLASSTGVFHWDGKTMIDFPDGPRGLGFAGASLGEGWKVWGSGPKNVWACAAPASAGNSTTATCMQWDGASWKDADIDTDQPVVGLWGSSANDVWFLTTDEVYSRANLAEPHSTLRHFNGTTVDNTLEVATMLTGISGASSSNVWAVGNQGATLQFHAPSAANPP